VALGGCGDDEFASGAGSGGVDLVDPDRRTLINSLSVAPGGEEILVTTNQGFFRIADGEATEVKAVVSSPDGRSPVGTFLAVASLEGETLIGSGHPDKKGRLAGFLGLLRSDDGGRHWEVVSRYGIADLHVMRSAHGSLYAYDAFIPSFLISDDEGRTWTEQEPVPGTGLDFVVDPADPGHLIASNENAVFSSEDGATSWRSVVEADAARLAWPEAGSLYRADAGGLVYRSSNAGESWELVGRIDGEPWKLEATGSEELYAALADATIVRSTDGGASWEEVFTP
jgi:photosystem II stability/assembly factor-like uncharacterized protein